MLTSKKKKCPVCELLNSSRQRKCRNCGTKLPSDGTGALAMGVIVSILAAGLGVAAFKHYQEVQAEKARQVKIEQELEEQRKIAERHAAEKILADEAVRLKRIAEEAQNKPIPLHPPPRPSLTDGGRTDHLPIRPIQPTVVESFQATPGCVAAGGSVTLSWSVKNVDLVKIVALAPSGAKIENVGHYREQEATNGSVPVSPSATVIYQLINDVNNKPLRDITVTVPCP